VAQICVNSGNIVANQCGRCLEMVPKLLQRGRGCANHFGVATYLSAL
jgi:hypothetical protein